MRLLASGRRGQGLRHLLILKSVLLTSVPSWERGSCIWGRISWRCSHSFQSTPRSPMPSSPGGRRGSPGSRLCLSDLEAEARNGGTLPKVTQSETNPDEDPGPSLLVLLLSARWGTPCPETVSSAWWHHPWVLGPVGTAPGLLTVPSPLLFSRVL